MRISDWSSDVCSSDLHGWDHPVDEQAHAQDSEHDAAQGQLEYGLAVLEQFFPRNAPPGEKQQRRQEQQEEDFGIERNPPVRGEADYSPERDLEEGAGERQRHYPGQDAAQNDCEQQQKNDRYGLQGPSGSLHNEF